MKQLALCLLVCLVAVFVSSCSTPTATPVSAPTSPPLAATAAVGAAATTTALLPTPLQPAATSLPSVTPVPPTGTPVPPAATPVPPTSSAAGTATTLPSATQAATPAASFNYPPPPTGIPSSLPPAQPLGSYVAFAWNNLGMHCYQQDFSMFVILPPYNVLWTQVVARGEDPRILRGNVTVQYSVPPVKDPAAHTDFWQYAADYGWQLAPGIGLTGKGTSGSMDAAGDHWIAEGVPVVDRNDDGTWDPYPFFVVDVLNNAGQQLVQTVNVAPASSEMSCYLCHAADTVQASMANILAAHDKREGTSLLSQAGAGQPQACNVCHADPAMGVMTNQGSQTTLSGAMHTFHADKLNVSQVPANQCQACHPGPQTECQRGAMAKAGVTCTDCHGSMTDVGSPARTPWVNLPDCETCHTTSLTKATIKHIDNPNQYLTANDSSLFRNSKAHGGGGIYCPACHGSPHAIYPTLTELDNVQSTRLQGHSGTISECTVCHTGRPERSFWHFGRGD